MLKKTLTVLAVVAAATVALPASSASATTLCTTYTEVHVPSSGYPGYNLYLIPATSGGSQKCDLFKGDGPDDAVRVLQDSIDSCFIQPGLLIHHGNPAMLDIDGEFGTLTKAALTDVQNFLMISADGGYGPQTRAAMYWEDFQHDGIQCARVPVPQ